MPEKHLRRVRFLVPHPPVPSSPVRSVAYRAEELPFGGVQAHAGPEELVAYGYYDLATLKGVDPASARRAASRGQLDLGDLLSCARWVYSRRICRCCERPMLPVDDEEPEDELPLPQLEPTGPPKPWSHPPREAEKVCPFCWDGERIACGRAGCSCPCH